MMIPAKVHRLSHRFWWVVEDCRIVQLQMMNHIATFSSGNGEGSSMCKGCGIGVDGKQHKLPCRQERAGARLRLNVCLCHDLGRASLPDQQAEVVQLSIRSDSVTVCGC